MAKKLTKVELNIVGTPDAQGDWQIKVSADLTISAEEYPEFERRKGITLTLTPTQEATILNFVRTVILPQAEGAK